MTGEKTALVTGGGRGIGAASARALAAAGFRVVLASRSEDELRAVAGEIGNAAHVLPWDLGGESGAALVEACLRAYGRLDVLVHAAGNQVRKPTAEFTLDDWDSVMDVHLRAAFTLGQAALAHMGARGGGSIVFVGSMTSKRLGHPSTVAYAAAKSGLLGLARTLAVEYAGVGVRVNTVLPGFIASAMADEVAETPQRKALTARIPQGRYGTGDDVAEVVAFLAGDGARYVTGETISVDGGWSVA